MRSLITTVDLEVAYDQSTLAQHVRGLVGLSEEDPLLFRIKRRSLDARHRRLRARLEVEVFQNQQEQLEHAPPPLTLRPVSPEAPRLIIVGAGPAGLFAALRALSLGIRPIIVERGKDVRRRRRDLAQLNRVGEVNPDSNYCFGEGGAGTYSDGKLYTRAKKRGSVRAILQLLVDHGAPSEILFEAQPHIGTNRLPKVIQSIRETIINCGGEVKFDARVVDLERRISSGDVVLSGVRLAHGEVLTGEAGVILATGHSARDIFSMLHRREVLIEAKPFALGVRVEHPQSYINHTQYHGQNPPQLGSASYKLVTQVQKRGVFSFCMCPGGIIAPAATASGEIVVNGWSPYKRNGDYANSGIVVSVTEKDFAPFITPDEAPLAGVRFQAQVEQSAFRAAGSEGVIAPAQRLRDFCKRKVSATLPKNSYIPGVRSVDLNTVLPAEVARRLRLGFKDFGRALQGYLHPEAILVGVESRTSSPVRIPRDPQTLEHPTHRRLFPCGEGAGYAGGIMSAAFDGFRCAEAAARSWGETRDLWQVPLNNYRSISGGK